MFPAAPLAAQESSGFNSAISRGWWAGADHQVAEQEQGVGSARSELCGSAGSCLCRVIILWGCEMLAGGPRYLSASSEECCGNSKCPLAGLSSEIFLPVGGE